MLALKYWYRLETLEIAQGDQADHHHRFNTILYLSVLLFQLALYLFAEGNRL